MSTSYTLQFSDPTKTATIIVLGSAIGSGKNTTSTSLELIGPGYINYGQATAQNFLKILENSASMYAPDHAIEGQLWYDTGNPNRKVLRINNGTSNSKQWPSASGIYQQPNDPSIEYSDNIVDGDLWADITNNQLKIRHSNGWTVVGPSTGTGETRTGSEQAILVSNTGTSFPVILNWANGKVIEIISHDTFIPETVIDGFELIKVGVNLTSRLSAKFNGLAENASALKFANGSVLVPSDILKNTATSQTHTGTFIVNAGSGFYVNDSLTDRSIRIYNTSSGGVINYAGPISALQVGIDSHSYMKFSGQFNNIGINTSTIATSPTLDVYGTGRYANTLTITTTASIALSVGGGTSIGGSLYVSKNITTLGAVTSNSLLTVGAPSGSGTIIEPATSDIFDIGRPEKAFRRLYVSQIGIDGTNVDIYGTLYGTATGLAVRRDIKLQGQVASNTVEFNGDANVVLNTVFTRAVIADQPATTSTTATQTLLILNTATTSTSLQKISKADFLADIFPSGMIIPASTTTPYSGFLVCDGTSHSRTSYASLFSAIGIRYGSTGSTVFNVPDMRNITTAAGGYAVYYQIKI